MNQLKLREAMGSIFREQRLDRGETLRVVGAGSQVSVGYLSELERGKKEPSSEVVAAICDHFDMSMSEFLARLSAEYAVLEHATGEVCLAA